MPDYERLASTVNMSREEWLRVRKLGIGGSDASAIVGLSPWKSPINIFLDKTTDEISTEENQYMRWGTKLEPLIRSEFAEVTGFKVQQMHCVMRNIQHPFLLANIDGVVHHPEMGKGGLECKTASLSKRREWGDDDDPRIPEEYEVQCHHYMMVTGFPFWYIAALIGGNEFCYRLIMRDRDLEASLFKVEAEFWSLVQSRTMPAIDGSDACTEYLAKRYAASTATTRDLPPDAVEWAEGYKNTMAAIKALEEQKQHFGNLIRESLGEHQVGIAGDWHLSWKPTTTNRLDTKKLAEEYPDVYDGCCVQSVSRRLLVSHKPPKTGKEKS